MKINLVFNGFILFVLIYILNMKYHFTGYRNDNFRNQNSKIIVQHYDKNILLGKYKPEQDSNFCRVSKQFASKDNIYLHKECYQAFLKMHAAAQKDSINLIIVSGMRSFEYQKGIWEAKWSGQRLVEGKNLSQLNLSEIDKVKMILRYNAMPGISRHHWGTDIDLNSVDAKYFASGKGKKIFLWLEKNAANYGFYRPYTIKNSSRLSGHEAEEWHWSYVPLSKKMLEEYNKTITYKDLINFSGAAFAEQIDVFGNFVNGIHPLCKP